MHDHALAAARPRAQGGRRTLTLTLTAHLSPFTLTLTLNKAAGVEFEFAEYLKGETHYIVVTIKKKSLLAHGVLKEDLPQAELTLSPTLTLALTLTLTQAGARAA